jgi:type IV secretion system protein VirB10
MVQSLQLGTSSQADDHQGMRRLNRLPIIVAIIFIVLFVGVVVIGLSLRGLSFNRGDIESASNSPATSLGDQLKRGVTDGIIGDPEKQEVFQPTPRKRPVRAVLRG